MPHPTRQAILRLAAAAFVIALAVYFGGYFSLSNRIEAVDGNLQWSSLSFRSKTIAAAYLPLGMIEAAGRQRAIVLSAESDIEWISWTCRPLELPDILEMPPRYELRLSP